VYDQDRHRAHRLNRTAAVVWRSCNGRRTVGDLARIVEKEVGAGDENVVRLALDRLAGASLLTGAVTSDGPKISRRELLRRIRTGSMIGLALPLVSSIVAPAPAEAATQPGCCTCAGRTGCQDTQSEQACITFCGTAVATFQPGKSCNEQTRRCA
jgi:hypothetical protein